MDLPETRYATTVDGAHIAYHVVGDGAVDVLWIHSFIGGLELLMEHPLIRSLTERVASFGRVIRHDMRGTGLSDRHDGLPDLETQAQDILAVLDAAGSRTTVIVSAANAAGVLFATLYPRRTRALCLFDLSARQLQADDYAWGVTEEEALTDIEQAGRLWGTDAYAAAFLEDVAPSLIGDREVVRWYARLQRHWVAPGDAVELLRRWYDTDVSDLLPSISVPTICIARQWEGGTDEISFAAARIPDARLVVLPGADRYSAAGDQDALVGAIRDFVGVEPPSGSTGSELRAILFTDIVDSTKTAFALGADAWKQLLERHHSIVRGQLEIFEGTEVDTAGDGFFATFAGPARAIRCAQAIADAMAELGIEIRAGIHVGECDVIDGHAGGPAVFIGARVGALAGASEVLVSQTVKDLTAGSGLTFEDTGEHELKGVPDRWHLYRVVS